MKHAHGVTRKAVLFFAVLTTAAVWSKPVTAQPAQPQATNVSQEQQAQDVQQLKAKLQQLEQMMDEVKGKLNELESRPASNHASEGGPNNSLASAVTSFDADPTTHSYGAASGAPPVGKQADQKKPGSESTLDIYGFAMMDSGYDFGSIDPNWFDVVRPTKLPATKNEFGPNGNTFWSVRQTRFGVKSSTPTSFGDLKTIFEFELFGTGVDAGQTTFRLRHAWGEVGHFGAGQTFSPFMDINVFPNSIEYWGPNSMVFFRNVQFRWTPIKTDRNTFMIAAERPGASADQGIYSGRIELSNITPQFILPDLSMQGHFDRKWDTSSLQVCSEELLGRTTTELQS
jgi:hypothetical protein